MATASKPDTSEEESFIILGSSPGTSLDLKCDGINGSLDRINLDDALKDLSGEASMAFKAHFKLNSGPSPASLMVASTIITDDKSTEELQKRFGELLDENVILKETLQRNNDSMKEQFLLIASCQEDMLKTHMLHKEKFDETRDLVEKLRQENKKLKQDISRLAEQEASPAPSSGQSSGPMSALEFVTSPEDDTVDKLTAQLELVEKQRRQVIVDNEKLTWQKESLEHIIDATSKERDDLKEKLKVLELKLSSIENENAVKMNLLNESIVDLQTKLEMELTSSKASQNEELEARLKAMGRTSGNKISSLQAELKQSQLKILELESVKLEFSKHKAAVSDTIKMYRDHIQELQNKMKDAHTTVFQPVRLSVTPESESNSSEYAQFLTNVKLYDKTLKHLADLLNLVSHGSIDGLVSLLGVVASIQDMKLKAGGVEQIKASMAALRKQLHKQHDTALGNIGQVKGTLSIFEGIFKDYNDLLKKEVTRQESKPPVVRASNAAAVEQLTAALVARGSELAAVQGELQALREDRQLLAAQLDLYRSDFEAEREAREKMASEKETILTDLRTAQKRIQDLTKQLEQVRKINPSIYLQATRPQPTGPNQGPPGPQRPASAGPQSGTRRQSAPGTAATGNMVYTCPKCLRFSSDQYRAMEDHFDFCLDDF